MLPWLVGDTADWLPPTSEINDAAAEGADAAAADNDTTLDVDVEDDAFDVLMISDDPDSDDAKTAGGCGMVVAQ